MSIVWIEGSQTVRDEESVMERRYHRKSLPKHARWFVQEVLRDLSKDDSDRASRVIRFEPLERRELMASDFFESTVASAPPSAYVAVASSSGSSSNSQSSLQAEGEAVAANDLVAFAKALTAAGAKLYGADWSDTTTQQRLLFAEGASYLPFVEVTNADRTLNAIGTQQSITTYPTWKFANNTTLTGVQTLAQIATTSGVAIPQGTTPSIIEIPNQTVLFRSPLNIPVDTYDPNGGPLTVTVTSSNPSAISAQLVTNTKSVKMVVNGYGEMVYRLYADDAPRPVGRFEQLVNSGFYNQTNSSQIIFHRVIPGFVIQGGDPTGTGGGGSSLGTFDDQFNVNLQHNATGVLSYAKSGDDTNDSQFFVTEGPQRHLDFNHSIFGQLVQGEAVRAAIARTKATSSRPDNPVVISSMQIFNDDKNGLVRLKSTGTSGSSTITVTVTNAAGKSFSRTFVASAAPDTNNGTPFLNDIAVPPIAPGQTVTIQLSAQDKEGDAVRYGSTRQGSVPYVYNLDSNTGLLTVTAPANFTGSFNLNVGVQAASVAASAPLDDNETLTFNVADVLSAPTSIDLVAQTDSGSSNSDNITNVSNMQFVVNGTKTGATVTLKVGNQTVGSAVATGTTTTISTSQVSALGDGTYSIVATQTLSNQTSAASPALTVRYDSTAPAAIPADQLPTRANVGTLLSVNLSHPEEGNGIQYVLDNAPAGMSIDSATGVLTWTPTALQLGPQTATLRITDVAGNVQSQSLAINVADVAKVSVSLAIQSTTGQPLASLSLNQEFNLKLTLQDLRTDAVETGQGVFSAYLDLLYDKDKFELVGTNPVTYASLFGNGQTADTTVAGLINEMGAFSSLTNGPGRNPQDFITVRMRAKASGSAAFTINEAETAGRGFAVFKEDTAVPANRVVFGTAAVTVSQNFTLVNDTKSVNEDSTNNTIDVLANDTTVPNTNTTLSIQSVSTPSQGGTVSISSDNQRLIYTPKPNFNGNETFTYTARDQTGASATATVTIAVQPINDNPVANNDTYTTVRSGDKDVFLDVLSNDTSGPDTGETLTVQSVGTPTQGGLVKLATGNNGVLYTPKAGFVGTETFTYVLSDGKGGTATGTVSVVVAPAVPPPTVAGESFTVVEDAPAAEFDVLANDTPAASGDTLTVTAASSPNGIVTITSNGTKVSYAPKLNFNGKDLVIYTVRSSNGGTAQGTMTMTVTPVNDAPTAVDDSLTVLSTPNQSVDVLANDTNVDSGETLTISSVTQPASGKGTISIATGSKSLIYTAPNVDFTGSVSFQYTIDDGTGLKSTANVTLNVINFVPRDVGITTITTVQGVMIQAQQLSGPSISSPQSLTPSSQGKVVKVANVGPGTYQFSVPTLPFFLPKETSKNVVSDMNDGASVATTLNVGTRDPRFMDLRDFTSQNLRKGMTVAVQPNQQALWFDGVQDWRNYSNIKVTLNSAATQLTINAINPTNQNVQASLATTDPKVSLRRKDGNNHLFRIQAAPSELTFTPVTATPAATTTNTGSSSSGEGEGRSTPSTSTLKAANVDSAIPQFATGTKQLATPPIELNQVIDTLAKDPSRTVSLSSFRTPR
jgi:cyclophilin family peptidyl-prolyl cis-trans isomerase